MTSSNIALEVAGVFLVMGGLMYLSLSGKLGDMFRDRAPKPLLLIAVVVGFAFYHWGQLLYSYADSPAPEVSVAPGTPEATAKIAPPGPKPVVRRRARPVPAAVAEVPDPPEPPPTTVIVEDVPTAEPVIPPAADAPPPVMPSPSVDPYESKAKRGLKAVGRFLHLSKKTKQEP